MDARVIILVSEDSSPKRWALRAAGIAAEPARGQRAWAAAGSVRRQRRRDGAVHRQVALRIRGALTVQLRGRVIDLGPELNRRGEASRGFRQQRERLLEVL